MQLKYLCEQGKSMIKELIHNFYSMLLKKPTIGVSFDNSVKLKKEPKTFPNDRSIFYKLNTDLGYFEVTKVSVKQDLIYITEIGTANEYVLNSKLFQDLFSNVPIPSELDF